MTDPGGAGGADDVEEGVGAVELGGVASEKDEGGGVDTDHVDDEDVTSPGRDHVDVGEAGNYADGPGVIVTQRSAPEEEG